MDTFNASKSGNRITPQNRELAMQRYAAGEGINKLAAEFGVTKGAISGLASRRGILRRTGDTSNKLSAIQKSEAIRLYQSGQSGLEVAKTFDVAPCSIYALMRRRNIERRQFGDSSKRMSEAEKSEIIRRYLQGETTIALAAEFGFSFTGICCMMESKGIPRRDQSTVQRKYQVDHDFFADIVSEPQAYWLGFLAGDGGINRQSVELGLQERDGVHLQKFLLDLSSDYPLKFQVVKQRDERCGRQNMYRLSICSAKMVGDLAQWGVTKKKSFTVRWPSELCDPLLRHYLRGLFDADGCWHYSESRRMFKWSLVSASKEAMIVPCQQFLATKLGLPLNTLRKNGNVFSASWQGNRQTARIAHFMYDEANVFLARKRLLVEPLMQR